MDPNAPKDPFDPTPSPLPGSPDIPPPPPQPPSEPFVPPAPPTIDPAPPGSSSIPPSSDLPPGAPPPAPASAFTRSDTPPLPPPVSDLASGDVAPAVPSTKDERLWATLIHVGGIVGLSLAHFMIPGNILIPLVLWLIKREGHSFVDQQGKEALNFQITIGIAWVVAWLLVPVACIGFLLMPVVAITAVVLGIIAAVKANEGVAYRYPFCLRLIN